MNATRVKGGKAARWAPALLWAAAAALVLGGCSAERRHRVLTFFFDGVPPLGGAKARDEGPEAVAGLSAAERAAGPRPPMLYHKPYAERACDRCHPKEASFFLGETFDRRGNCFQCHEHAPFKDRLERYAYVHGPVAIWNCLACHDPHESIHPGLLLYPQPKLCFACHDRERVLAADAHREIGDATCSSCHDPHGGSTPSFLREGALPPGAGPGSNGPPPASGEG